MGNDETRTLEGRVALVTGASRGIGREIAVRAGRDGAKVALLARTDMPDPRISGTLWEAADAVRAAGGQPFVVTCDLRDGAHVTAAVSKTAERFGGIDIVVNNAGALDLRPTAELSPTGFQRLIGVNVAGVFAVTQAALGYLRQSDNPHVLNISPPLQLDPSWLTPHVGHTVSKYAESLLTMGWAAELAADGIAVNSLWPATTIASTGMLTVMGEDVVNAQARTPEIMADAVHALVTRPATECTGGFYTDEQVLREEGVSDLSGYRLAAREEDLTPNFYLTPTAPRST
ncbi:SDR family oxidoreductase [Mycolicibacterium pulveris]|uniref:SDR family oxidoreductase n=1 Tax=Mycolicibacterium pulveris TaxID=36813 RepID=UPI0038996C9C